ncbi:hypothetical protein BH10PSE8_BH10PSE8_03920 [soil metagenome]
MSGSVFGAVTGFLRGVGNQAAISVAASAIAAALFSLPGGIALPFFGAAADQAEANPAAAERWLSPVASDGQIRERHHDAVGNEPPLRASDLPGLVSPAAIVMPMAREWTQPVVEIAGLPQLRPASAVEPRARAVQAQALPPRRPAIERAIVVANAAPLPIAPAAVPVVANAAAASETARPQRSVLGVSVPAPVSRMGEAVYGAVGLVGAAGTWPLSRASDLLPRL